MGREVEEEDGRCVNGNAGGECKKGRMTRFEEVQGGKEGGRGVDD